MLGEWTDYAPNFGMSQLPMPVVIGGRKTNTANFRDGTPAPVFSGGETLGRLFLSPGWPLRQHHPIAAGDDVEDRMRRFVAETGAAERWRFFSGIFALRTH